MITFRWESGTRREETRTRVLFIISQLGLGGQEKRLVELAAALQCQPDVVPSVLVFERGGVRERWLREKGVQVFTLDAASSRGKRLKEIYKLSRLLKPDIVHCFNQSAGLYGRLGARLARVPVVFSSFNSGRIYGNGIRITETLLSPLINKMICNSVRGSEYLMQKCWMSPARIAVVPNGFSFECMDNSDAMRTSLRAELGIDKDRPLIGMVGKLDANKDPGTLIRAASLASRRFPSAVFVIIGSGPHYEDVDRLIVEEGLEGRFFLAGQRPDAPWLIREFDIGVLSSISEGMPNVVLEYMYWSKPVVVTDVGDCGRIVEHCVTGLVVPPRNDAAFADALCSLLQDRNRADSMGLNGRTRLEALYPIERYVNDIVQLYRSEMHSKELMACRPGSVSV